MDAYQPTAAMRAEAIEHRRIEAYRDGVADERQKWLPLAGELRARILHKHQFGGTVLLSLEDVMSLSLALARAEGRAS